MVAYFGVRCHRCYQPMTLYVVGVDYCRDCLREMKARDEADAKRKVVRFPHAKAWGPVA